MDGEFTDRLDAGRQLAQAVARYRSGDAIVLGMARGGVVVGYAVAIALDLPLEALVIQKVGAPENPELALGAVSETGVSWLDPYLVAATGASETYVERETEREVAEAKRRQREYAIGPGLNAVKGRPVLVVDDGIATGASALVAVESVRDLGASTVVLAVPVASPQAVEFLQPHVDRLIVLDSPEPFMAVGLYYKHFGQVTDAEVKDYLAKANENYGASS